jgi:protein-S-isoprenylcysteine O-methyltransferase Ste14
MLLSQKIGSSGDVLFRWRSYVILLFLPLLVLALSRGEPVEQVAGTTVEAVYAAFCLLLVAGGLLLRAFTVGFVPARTSGRNTKGQAAQVLNTTRNPLYLANCAVYLGVVLFAQSLMLALAFALFLVIYYERIIMAEEAFLVERFGEDYLRWAAEVPVFLPRLRGWRKPALPFSLRSVLRREYPGWLAAAFALFAVETGGDLFGRTGEPPVEPGWALGLLLIATLCLALRVLKKRTRLLDSPGR